MAADSRGYYAQLGLSPGASIDVVRAVYRQLAKECHPDRPGCNDGGERFRKITEAYEALSDLAFKAAYDSGEQARGEEDNSEQATQIDPVLCQVCGRVTAQPRRLAFWRVTSLILASQKNPIQRIYCRDCAGKEQWKSTIWTSLLGWWGIPWGPVWAIQHGVMNAIGGSREEKVDEALMWQNAIAFAMRGEGQLAVGLSNILRKSDDAEIGQKSAEIIRFFADRGVDPRSTLADVWRRSIWRTAALFGIAFAVPAAAVAIIVIPASNVQESYSAPSDATDAPNNLESSGETSGLPATETSSESATPDIPVPTCDTPPSNGEILVDNRETRSDGHVLQIENGSVGDAIIKVRDASADRLVASFFVGRGQSAALKNIPDGNYIIQYAAGDKLAPDCRTFVNDGTASASQFPSPEALETKYQEVPEGTEVIHGRLTYTLYSVPNGNVRPTDISMDDFNKP